MRLLILIAILVMGMAINARLVEIRDGVKCNRETPLGQSVCYHGK